MTKSSKKRKAALDARLSSVFKKPKSLNPPAADYETPLSGGVTPTAAIAQDGLLGGLLYEDELETTTETILTLAQNPTLISLKALKPFKTAVHDYWRVAHETSNTGACISLRCNDVRFSAVM